MDMVGMRCNNKTETSEIDSLRVKYALCKSVNWPLCIFTNVVSLVYKWRKSTKSVVRRGGRTDRKSVV